MKLRNSEPGRNLYLVWSLAQNVGQLFVRAALTLIALTAHAVGLSALEAHPMARLQYESFAAGASSKTAASDYHAFKALEQRLKTRHVSKCYSHDRLYPCIKYDDPGVDWEEVPNLVEHPYYV